MKKMRMPHLVIALFLASCSNEKTETPCDCNEMIDKRIILYHVQIYVEDCETKDASWIDVTPQEFDDSYVGECFKY